MNTLEYVDMTALDPALQEAAQQFAAVVGADSSYEAWEGAYEALQDAVGDHPDYPTLEELLGF